MVMVLGAGARSLLAACVLLVRRFKRVVLTVLTLQKSSALRMRPAMFPDCRGLLMLLKGSSGTCAGHGLL